MQEVQKRLVWPPWVSEGCRCRRRGVRCRRLPAHSSAPPAQFGARLGIVLRPPQWRPRPRLRLPR